VKCRRCNGKGELIIRFALPGQSTRVDGVVVEEGVTTEGGKWTRHEGGGYSFAHIVWEDEPRNLGECRVCMGFGYEPDEPNKQAGKRVRIQDESDA
jgi:hypothetical protein